MPVKIRKSGVWTTVSDGADGADGTSTLPTGCIIMFNGTTAPTGWALCDGGGGRPDLRNRFVIGAGNNYGLAATGGYTDTPIINHNHTFSSSTSNDGAHTHSYNFRAGTERADNDEDHSRNSGSSSYQTGSAGGHSHSFSGTTNSASNSINSGAGRNIPPYYALTYIIKT